MLSLSPSSSILLLFCAIDPASGGSDWPQFRGPFGTGNAPAADIPLGWSETENVAWKVKVPGSGWSQPVVIGDTVFLTMAVGEGLERPMGLEAGVADPRTKEAGKTPDVVVDWRVIALDLATGQERWSRSAVRGKPAHAIHPSNTYATETPCADASGVYAFFGAPGTLAAFDPAGKALWKIELGAHPTALSYGQSASPAIHDGKLFVQCFNDDSAFLVCLDAKSGAEKWRVQREKASTCWASPLVWRNAERSELVASGDKLVTSHDLASGKELWRVAGVDGPGMCSFGADSERLYFGQKNPMSSPPFYAVPAGAEGDLSPAKGSTDVRGQAWAMKGASPGLPSPVVVDGLLYVTAESILTCRDAASGEELYKERLPDMVTALASPIAVGDKLVLLDEEGRAAIVQAGAELEIVGKGKLDDMFWATPSAAGNSLLLRGVDHLYCVRK